MKLIVATDLKFGIGMDNNLPWSFAKDMQHFKNLTTQNPNTLVLMGRKTYESIPKKFKPLTDRLNIVISTQDLSQQGFIHVSDFRNDISKAYFINTLHELREFLSNNPDFEVFCIGGQSVYDLCLQQNMITEIYHTQIHSQFNCDRFIKDYINRFKIIESQDTTDLNRNDKQEYKLTFHHAVLN